MTTKQRKRHSPKQIVKNLRNADAMQHGGQDLAFALRALETREERTTAGGTSTAA